MKIASWNVNSIKARLDHVKKWLELHHPDVLMVQELKGTEFPTDALKSLGYESAAVTQKAYNGVAILAREPFESVTDRLPGDKTDEQARYLEIEYKGLRLIDIYLPNGNPIDSEKYDYKLGWMDRLRARLEGLRAKDVPFAIGGDFNVIPADADCYDPAAWANDALFHLKTRQKFRALLHLGLTDALRVYNRKPGQYTFWDYQGGAWPANKGIRIDHFLLSPALADRLKSCTIDSEPRGWEKASDHTPILLEIKDK